MENQCEIRGENEEEKKGAMGVRDLLTQRNFQSKDNYSMEDKSCKSDSDEKEQNDETDSCMRVAYKNQNDKRFGFKQQMERDQIDVRIIPAQFHRTNSVQGSPVPSYRMTSLPRGIAIILNIERYHNQVQSSRTGSSVDVSALEQLLTGLQFDVAIHQDPDLASFFATTIQFRDDPRHEVGDMAVVVILSHGGDGVVYTADGRSVDMEYFYEFFNNKNCPALRGKPKFFIIQACRGDMPDSGVDHMFIEKKLIPTPCPPTPPRTDTDAVALTSLVTYSVHNILRARPTWEDMIMVYSTIPGYASIRDHDKGTWFVQALVEVFMNHAHSTELVDLLRMTSERLSQFTNEEGEKQTCNVEMRHLYKRIYLNPGLGVSQSPMTRSRSSPPVRLPRAKPLSWTVEEEEEGEEHLSCQNDEDLSCQNDDEDDELIGGGSRPRARKRDRLNKWVKSLIYSSYTGLVKPTSVGNTGLVKPTSVGNYNTFFSIQE